jgi:hypothetical protein
VVLRTSPSTRFTQIVFAGGNSAKAERVRQTLPDAVFVEWPSVVRAVAQALSTPTWAPVVPHSNLAGYSCTPLPRKLGIKPRSVITLLNEPEGFAELLGELPEGARLTRKIGAGTSIVIWFVRSERELSANAASIAAQLGAGRLWIAWPKQSSPLASDVSEHRVRTAGLAEGLVDYKVAAIDRDWSGLLFAPRKAAATASKK